MTQVGYKLFRKRRDGSLGPLFIDARRRVPLGKWLEAENVPTKGFAVRPGWHLAREPRADHLSTKGRVWCEVHYQDAYTFKRPANQGGAWIIASRIKVVRELTEG